MNQDESTTSGEDTLTAALARYGIELPPDQIAALDRYRAVLWEWNQRLNLTRHTDLDKFVGRDLVDSLVFARFLQPGERVLDVGTGGGVPGIVLAIVRPDLSVSLCESVGKKARAVDAIVKELKLPVPVHASRVQELLTRQRYDTLVVRAVAPLADLAEWLAPRIEKFGRALVLKGPKWLEERKKARERGAMRTLSLRRIWSYPLTGTDSESVLLELRRKSPGMEQDEPSE